MKWFRVTQTLSFKPFCPSVFKKNIFNHGLSLKSTDAGDMREISGSQQSFFFLFIIFFKGPHACWWHKRTQRNPLQTGCWRTNDWKALAALCWPDETMTSEAKWKPPSPAPAACLESILTDKRGKDCNRDSFIVLFCCSAFRPSDELHCSLKRLIPCCLCFALFHG